MAARSRFIPESRNPDQTGNLHLSLSSSFDLLVGRWKSLRRRRIILAILAGWLLYLFFRNMPTDVPPVSERYDPRYGRLRPLPLNPHRRPGSDSASSSPETPGQSYEGPIRFYHLAETLQGARLPRDSRGAVLFAVSDLKTIPLVLPLACSMAEHNRTRVHLAFMGRHSAPWQEIRETNGISDTGCDIQVHDARPDFSAQSSVSRLDVAARAGLGHIYATLQLQAVVTGDDEDEWFANALRDKSALLGLTLFTLPAGGLQTLSWVSALDASSFAEIDKIQIDIVIQAAPESSASLIRLLRSIKAADYSGWALPRVTVELPVKVDPFLKQYLADFRWPTHGPGSESRLVVRHRLPPKLMTAAQASMRTVESFYPVAGGNAHVLLLSPNVELSPNYYQFVMFSVLEYRYATSRQGVASRSIGIALDLPPYAPDLKTKAPWSPARPAEPFVFWQAPISSAALYFGDRWMEFHDFLSLRLSADANLVQRTKSAPGLSREFPAWLQPMLEMMQVQGYYMLYPTILQAERLAAVTVHHELAQSPDEHGADQADGRTRVDTSRMALSEERPLTADNEIRTLMQQERQVYSDSLTGPLLASVLDDLRQNGPPLEMRVPPLISFDGEQRSWALDDATNFRLAEEFATSVGGCRSYAPSLQEMDLIESLFCGPSG